MSLCFCRSLPQSSTVVHAGEQDDRLKVVPGLHRLMTNRYSVHPYSGVLRQEFCGFRSPAPSWPSPQVLVGEPQLESLESRFSQPGAEESDRKPRPGKPQSKRQT